MPSLPNFYMPRENELAELKALILGEGQITGIASRQKAVSLRGMGGMGKTVMAAAVVHDTHVRQAFPHGIIWLTLGQNPNLTELQAMAAMFLGHEYAVFDSVGMGRAQLSKSFAEKRFLLILDDVWEEKHVKAFPLLPGGSRLLMTSRKKDLMEHLSHDRMIDLGLLSEKQALALLRKASDTKPGENLPSEADEVAKECGYLPLALAMVGAMVKKSKRWDVALERLKNAELDKIEANYFPHPNLFKAIHISIQDLPALLRLRYLDFAVFPEDWRIPETVFDVLWAEQDLEDWEPYEVLELF